MTFAELIKKLEAYGIVFPGYLDMKLFDIKIDTDSTIKVVLEDARISIPIH